MSHLTSCIPLKTEGPITGALSSCTQMNPNQINFLPEDSTQAQTTTVTTLQTSLFHHSEGEACKRTAVLKEPEGKGLIAAVISLRPWVNLNGCKGNYF